MYEHDYIFVSIICLYIFSIKLAYLLNRNILDMVYKMFILFNNTEYIHIIEFKKKEKLLKKCIEKTIYN